MPAGHEDDFLAAPIVTSAAPAATTSPVATCRALTVPATGASMRCSIFIASSTTSRSCSATVLPACTATLTILPGIGALTSPLPWMVPAWRAVALGGGAGTTLPCGGIPGASKGTSASRSP
jgi:hypothetical protein